MFTAGETTKEKKESGSGLYQLRRNLKKSCSRIRKRDIGGGSPVTKLISSRRETYHDEEQNDDGQAKGVKGLC